MAREASLNAFNKGMNQDLGKSVPQDGAYLEGRNIRIIANESPEESGVVVNVEGNSFSFKLEYDCATCAAIWQKTGAMTYYSGFLSVPQHAFVKVGENIWISGWDDNIQPNGAWTDDPNWYFNSNAQADIVDALGGKRPEFLLCTPELMADLINDGTFVPAYLYDSLFDLPEFSEYENLVEVLQDHPEFDITNFWYDPTSNVLQVPPIEAAFCPADPIGWTSIRDTVYIFAADNQRSNPGKVFEDMGGSEAKTSGYIFQVNFNPSTNDPSNPIELYTHEELNFSKRYPIEAVGRYETESFQRLYWTDNFNQVRTINVADPNIWDLIPDDLALSPSIEFSTPVVKGVFNGGALPAGMYQYSYRLKNSGGSETRFSAFTNFLHIVKGSEGGVNNYWLYSSDPEDNVEYNGTVPGEICAKSVRLEVDNIDQSYDTIEFAALYKSGPDGIASSYIFEERKIVGDRMIFTHSSHTNIVGLITLAELTAFTFNIKRAKTLAAKDNRLFLGNVISPYEELTFNARTYRYKRSDKRIYAFQPHDTLQTYADPHFDPETTLEYEGSLQNEDADDYATENEFNFTYQQNIDCLNPYNLDMIASIANPQFSYKYQTDGVTLGGEGPYIKYKFIKKALSGDKFVGSSSPAQGGAPFVDVRDTGGDCDGDSTFMDYKNPIVVEKFRGYQRDETYRFGVVLYDPQGNPGFVNWIGDIRFPRFKDVDKDCLEGNCTWTLSQTREAPLSTWDGNVPTTNEDFVSSYISGGSHSGTSLWMLENGEMFQSDTPQYTWDWENNTIDELDEDWTETVSYSISQLGAVFGGSDDVNYHQMYALGIQFEVSIPAEMKGKVSGYSIVRVKREEIDKTVLGIGMMHYMHRFDINQGAGNGAEAHASFRAEMNTWDYTNTELIGAPCGGELNSHLCSIDSPEFSFTGNYPQAGPCDWIEVVGGLNTGRSLNSYENDFMSPTTDDYYRKFYSHYVLYRDDMSDNIAEVIENPDGTFDIDPGSPGAVIHPPLNGDFFQPVIASKMEAGEKLSNNLLNNGAQDFGSGVQNVGVSATGDGCTDVRTFGIGCESLFVRFPAGGYVTGSDGELNFVNDWYSGVMVPPAAVRLAFPFWKDWMIGSPKLFDVTEAANFDTGLAYNQNDMYFSNFGESYEQPNVLYDASLQDTTLTFNEDSPKINDLRWFRNSQKLLVAWRRERDGFQYGGYRKNDRLRNVYIGTGSFVPFDKSMIGQSVPQRNWQGDIKSTVAAIPFKNVDVWGGDTYVHFYDFQKLRRWRNDNLAPDNTFGNGTNFSYNVCYAFPVESTLNLALRTGAHFANKSNFEGILDSAETPGGDEYQYESVYSAQNDLLQYYMKPLDYVDKDVFDSRILYSEEKINGDVADSWRIFKGGNYRDIDSAYGPINKLILHKENLFAFQDRGVNLLMINPTAVTTTTDSTALVLGTGAVIQDDKYVAKDIGCKHQWSILSTPKGLYWVDILTNSIYKIGMGKEGMADLSRIKGLRNYFEATLEKSNELPFTRYNNVMGYPHQLGDSPIMGSGIVTGYDAKNNEVLFSFLERWNLDGLGIVNEDGKPIRGVKVAFAETIAYSETAQAFTSFYDFGTGMFINTQDKLLSLYPSDMLDEEYYRYEAFRMNEFYLHNSGQYGQWYDIYFNSSVDFIINKYPSETKVFDNMEWHTEVLGPGGYGDVPGETWNEMHCRTDYQEANVLFLTEPELEQELLNDPNFIGEENLKRRERTWKSIVPRNEGGTSRLRDKYLKVLLVYYNEDNTIGDGLNKKLRAHFVKTKFRVSKR